ncbi:major facilitator superfamily protein, putative [Ichthyophthirius multifiliis]|uniref:Major facilitator superfamily protein, putative n=1 Tax=Ichthyophthirius multifiliis TaxID=5932 RepID=G0QJV4_ICHMU|nr:major facilitator superfamily protein, putative [Ichthyophthirius multifiliis]EGR34505.1 major facilitator superfamily protein, putative [Ichthyophthirius multifiliis]|eukprot:XP_004039809.1 major facilitator superfamily protein, putative [Ichthyophthirius multifiliis]
MENIKSLFLYKSQYNKQQWYIIFQQLKYINIKNQTLSALFVVQIYKEPYFICKNQQLCNEYNGACEEKSNIDYLNSYKSATLEYGLYCENRQKKLKQKIKINNIKRQLRLDGQALFFLGGFLGFFIISSLCDNFGRQISLRICIIVFFFGAFFQYLSNSYILLNFGNFLLGFASNPNLVLVNIYFNEISPNCKKQPYLLTIYCVYGFTEILYFLSSFYINNWRNLMLFVLIIPSLLTFWLIIFIKETPKYLMKTNTEKAFQILKYIGSFNGLELDIKVEQLEVFPTIQRQVYYFWDLFRYKSLRFNTIIFSLQAVFLSFQYYGIMFVSDLVGIEYGINTFFIGISETIGFTFNLFLVENRSRKKLYIGYQILACIGFFIFLLFDSTTNQYQQLVFMCVIKMFLGNQFNIFYLQTTEIFPSSIITIAIGFILAMGSVGAALIPYFLDFGNIQGLSLNIIFLVVGIVSLIFSFLGIETLNLQTQDYILEEYENCQYSEIINKEK